MMYRPLSGVPAFPLVLLLVSLLGACTSNKEPMYRSDSARSGERRTLEVPPDLITPARDGRFQTGTGRPVLASGQGQSAPVAAPGADINRSGRAQIVKAGAQRWLEVTGTPQVVWPQVRKFWEDLGFSIQSDSPQTYVLETDWAEKRTKGLGPLSNIPLLIRAFAGGLDRDKFRVRLEPAAEPGKVEVYLTHRRLEEVDLVSTAGASATPGSQPNIGWVARPGDPSLELEMLRLMMIAFGAEEKAATAAAAAPAAPDRARLVTAADGSQQLVVDATLERGWRQVGVSLDRIGMVVEDRDRAKGYYFVRYITDEDLGKRSSSWWPFGGDKKPETDQYRIVVAAEGEKTVVRVQDKAGAVAPAGSVRRILGLLHNELR